MSKRVPWRGGCLLANPFGVSAANLAPHQILGVPLEQHRPEVENVRRQNGSGKSCVFVFHIGVSQNETSLWSLHLLNNSFVPLQRFNVLTFQRLNSSLGVFLAIRSMSAIGITCPWSLAPPAATRFPSSIIIAVIVLPDRRQFRRSPQNTCSKQFWPWWER